MMIPVSPRVSRLSSITVPSVSLPISPALHGNVGRIEGSLLSSVCVCTFHFTSNLTGCSPRKVVHVEESIGGENEVPDRKRAQVDEHPSKVGKTARSDDDQNGRDTENEGEEDERDSGFDGSRDDRDDNEVTCEGDGSGEDKSTSQLHENDEAHTEAEDTAQVRDDNQFEQVVYGRVDPSSTLREKDSKGIGNDGLANCLRTEHHLAAREGSKHECSEITIFTEEEQVLLVKGIDNVLRVVLNDIRVGENWNPVTVSSLRRLDSVHRETTRKTGDSPEH